MRLEQGEVLELENEEYITAAVINNEGADYAYLISNFKPVKVKFAKIEYPDNDNLDITIINNQEKKLELLTLFSEEAQKNVNTAR